jgi:hypothetical protein
MHRNKHKSFLNVLLFLFFFFVFIYDIYTHTLYQSRASVTLSHFSYQLAFVFFVCIGQYNDDSQTARRIQQQQHQNGIESDEENDSSAMFQANYQYTPLKEYAAMRNGRTSDDNNMNGYQRKYIKFLFFF